MSKKIHMALIATYPRMAEIFLQLADGRKDIEGYNVYASFEHAVEVAKKMEGELDVILSRGGTAAYIQKAVNIPVTFIPITPFDLAQEVHRLPKDVKDVAFVHYRKSVYGVSDIAEMYGVRITEYEFENKQDIIRAVEDANERGIQVVIGGQVAIRHAKKLGMRGIEVSAGYEAVDHAIDEALHVIDEVRKEQTHTDQISSAFDALREGIVVTDSKKDIVLINPIADKLFHHRYHAKSHAGKDIIGEQCEALYQNPKAEHPSYFSRIGNATYTVTHLPIVRHGKFLGVVTRYEDVTKTQALEQKIRREIRSKGFVARYHLSDILTDSESMKQLVERAGVYAETDSAILIQGPSGTGKELFAQGIHNSSTRADRAFVAVNCAAIPESLLESELFGYEKGAFTGASSEGREGYFEMAHLGTLFLDEIGEIPLSVQTRLLRVLQEKEIMRIGGSKVIPVDVRVISATNKDLRREVREGRFREDLYYRLNILELKVPPLRERDDDAVMMAKQFCQAYGQDPSVIDSVAPLFRRYRWPGNVRELQNVTERYCILYPHLVGNDGKLPENLPDILGFAEGPDMEMESGKSLCVRIPFGQTLAEDVEGVERQILKWYLEEYGGKMEEAARALGISRTSFWRKTRENSEEK